MLLLLFACDPGRPETGSNTGGAPTGDPASVELAGPCPMETDFGGFVVEAYESSSLVSGTAADGVVPTTVLTVLLEAEGCALLRRENPFCDPPCGSGETCDLDGTCVPYPESRDLGTVTVRGLEAEVAMEPVVPGYSYFDTDLPHPPWAEGALVELETGGGDFDPVRLHGVGFPLLELLDAEWVVAEGRPLPLRWVPPATAGRAEVVFELTVDQHGVTPVTLTCTLPDDGEAEVPAELVDALLAEGVSGYPNGELARRTADHGPLGEGCLDFQLRAPRAVPVRVEGVTPCDDDRDCPSGQTCDDTTRICT